MSSTIPLKTLLTNKIILLEQNIEVMAKQLASANRLGFPHTAKAYANQIKILREGVRTYRECHMVLIAEGPEGVPYVKMLVADFEKMRKLQEG